MINQDIEFFKLKEFINDLDKVDLYYLNEYNQLQENEYDRYTKLRYEINFIYSILEDFEELKKTIDNISEYQNSIINNILNKLTDIKDIVDMESEDN